MRARNLRSAAFCPEGQEGGAGLLTSKRGELEKKDDLKRRIDEAAKYVPLDQICLSPQCGIFFHQRRKCAEPGTSSSRKLRLVVETRARFGGLNPNKRADEGVGCSPGGTAPTINFRDGTVGP